MDGVYEGSRVYWPLVTDKFFRTRRSVGVCTCVLHVYSLVFNNRSLHVELKCLK